MALLYSTTLFLSAFLVFAIEPVVGRVVLPVLGGTPGVWNTCLFFFQAMLLAGYLYAHGLSRAKRWQPLIHLPLLAVAIAIFPGLPRAEWVFDPPTEDSPSLWLLFVLIRWMALPFALLAATAPLLQAWYARSGLKRARDPYFLYAASNAGSLLGLLSYPFLIEPRLNLGAQTRAWNHGLIVLAGFVGLCGLLTRRSEEEAPAVSESVVLDMRTRLGWLACAFVPSSLLLGLTTYLSTDVAAVPLLWIGPLVLYLLSFVFVFSREFGDPKPLYGRLYGFGVLCALLLLIVGKNNPASIIFSLHLVLFFAACLFCHGELARRRPATSNLTSFYFWMSLGGVLGGLFNSLIAPNVFSTVVEYPLMMIAAAYFVRSPTGSAFDEIKRHAKLIAVILAVAIAATVACHALGVESEQARDFAILALPLVLCYRLISSPPAFVAGLASLYLLSALVLHDDAKQLARRRNFFGTVKVTRDVEHGYTMLFHGSTLHGLQAHDERAQNEPLAYFSKGSPIGQIFKRVNEEEGAAHSIGVIGLGAGTLATYAKTGDRWQFFEINPNVIQVAQSEELFTFLERSAALKPIAIFSGDARLKVQGAVDAGFDVLVMDAFSSDSIPTHLITREALELYWKKLKPEGLIAFNVSNRYFDFAPLLGALAHATGGRAYVQSHVPAPPEKDEPRVRFVSRWVVMGRPESKRLGFLTRDPAWHEIVPEQNKSVKIWTDDFIDILSLFRK